MLISRKENWLQTTVQEALRSKGRMFVSTHAIKFDIDMKSFYVILITTELFKIYF